MLGAFNRFGRDWSGVSLDEFADMLDAYLRWYRDVRLKSDLGYKSPMQYRRDLGLIGVGMMNWTPS